MRTRQGAAMISQPSAIAAFVMEHFLSRFGHSDERRMARLSGDVRLAGL
jgi:hypothetical protein